MWDIISGPIDIATGGDHSNWGWRLQDGEGNVRTVLVQVSGTASASADVPSTTREAIKSQGLTALDAVLERDVPPKRILLNTGPGIRYEWEDGRSENH